MDPEKWGSGTGGTGTVEDSSDAGSGSSSGTKSRLIIKVPNYDGGTAVSYIRLGAVPTDEEPGKTLADMVDPTSAFIDDDRDRDGGGGEADNGDSHGLTKTARKAASSALHAKGGWRDHSDGNRVTTTLGDKVEIIRGNYKMIVLGRQDDPEKGATYDASGGLVQGGDIAPGSISEIKWVQDAYSGTWKVTEETEKGDQKTVYHGDVEEIYYGRNVTTTVGSETGAGSIALLAGNEPTSSKENPTIVESTWAKSITSNTGSSGHRVPTITEVTHVETTKSETYCYMSKEILEANVILNSTAAGFIAEASAAGLRVEAYVGPVIETYVGAKLEIDLSAKLTISGPLTVELSFGKNIGLHNMKDEMDLMKTELTATMATEIGAAKTEITSATDTKIGTLSTRISKARTELGQARIAIQQVKTDLADLNSELANAHVFI